MAKTDPSPANAKEAMEVGYLSVGTLPEPFKTLAHQPVELAESLFVVAVPNVHIAVAATGGKGVVLLVEADGIHRVNVFNAIFFHSMAFECIFLLLRLRTWVEVFNGHPAFYRADNIARLVWEAPQASRLKELLISHANVIRAGPGTLG